VVVRALALALRGHRELVLENLALRQQLAAFRRKRCRLRPGDRLFWMALARTWRNVISAPASPWQNPYAERVIGSIRRDA
jgi:hypothetical protein